MGGGPDKEHLLITNYAPEPTELVKLIRQKFPYVEVSYVQTQTLFGNGEGEDKERMKGESFILEVHYSV